VAVPLQEGRYLRAPPELLDGGDHSEVSHVPSALSPAVASYVLRASALSGYHQLDFHAVMGTARLTHPDGGHAAPRRPVFPAP
jgi:hypothetical protein